MGGGSAGVVRGDVLTNAWRVRWRMRGPASVEGQACNDNCGDHTP